MAIKFSSSAKITLASPISIGASEDFRIVFPTLNRDISIQRAVIGSTTSSMAILPGNNTTRLQIDGNNADMPAPLTTGVDLSGIEVSRVGTTANTLYDGSTYTATTVATAFSFNLIGNYNNSGSNDFEGTMSGVMEIYNGTGTLIHSYDFEDYSDLTQLTDSVGGNHGTLSGFVTGDGYQVPSGGNSISISAPLNNATKYMDAAQYARISVSGSYAGTVEDINYNLDGGTSQSFESLAIDTENLTFEGVILVPNGEYDIEFFATNDATATDTVTGVRSVFSILIWGQSNGNGSGVNNQTLVLDSGAPYPLMCGTQSYSQIETLKDPTAGQTDSPGSMWPKFTSYLANEGLLVCLTNTCVNGSALSSWIEGGDNHDRPERLAELVGGYNMAISVIGESDSNNSDAIVYERMNSVINSYKLKYGCDTYISYVPRSILDNLDTEVNAYGRVIDENRFAKFGGYLGVIDVTTNDDPNIEADGTHLLTEDQLTQGAQIIYAAYKEDRGRGWYQSDAVMTLTGATGTLPTRVIDIDTGKEAYLGDVDWVDGTATIKVDAKVGANIEYNIMSDTAGGMQRGVTV